MGKDKIQYDAFISYRHSELDSFVAETLHRQLENFKLPGNVAKRKSAQAGNTTEALADHGAAADASVKTRIQRVFRDKEELPLASNLADPITEALQNSEYLIVICSPRLPESMWCRKEIETFIAMHDREHVLAVLVEGEPAVAFPEELLYREEQELGPDGSVIRMKTPVEPLAADVRGANYKEIRKKIKSELLRLVAPMFDCSYDDLKQRHREQRTRKILMTSMSVSAACLLFGIVSTTMALRIKQQNTQIRAQADEITAQAQEIEQQYREAKRNTAISRSKVAVGYLEQGDRLRAVATAQDALLELSGTGGIEAGVSYPAETVYALTDSLYLYENGQQILPDRVLEADTAVRVMKLTPRGSRLMTLDASGQAVVWDPEDMTEQIRIDVTVHTGSGENELAFLGEDCLFCPVGDEVVLYDLSDGNAAPVYRISCEDYVGIIVLQEQKCAMVLSENGYRAIDCTDGSTIYAGEWGLDGMTARTTAECIGSEDGRYWAVSLASSYAEENERRMVAVYSVGTGERLGAYTIEYEYVKSMRFDGERIYVVSNHSGEHDTTQVTSGMESCLQAFAVGGPDAPVWTYEKHNGWLFETSCARMDDSSYLLCSGYSDVTVLDKRDGSYIDLFGFGVEVIKLGNYSGSDNFMVFTRDGVWHYLSMERMEDMVGMLFPACTSANVMDFAIGDGYCVTLPYNSRRVTLYRTAAGEGLEDFYQGDYNYKEALVNGDGSCMAAAFYSDSYKTGVDLLDTGTGELRWRYEDDSYYKGMAFVDYNGQEALALLTDREVILLDPEEGERIASAQLELGTTFDYLGYSGGYGGSEGGQDACCFYLWNKGTLYGYDIVNMRYAYEIVHDGEAAYDDVIAVAGDPEHCYVITDKEEGVLRFYRMGELLYTYGGQESTPQQDEINYKYIETMFFDGWEQECHLNIVYMDGRITRLAVDPDAADFGITGSHDEEVGQYDSLEDVMRRYEHAGDYAIMRGNTDAYLLTQGQGDILAHLHGFLCYDSHNGQIYLTSSRAIYRLPLYTLEEINEIASKVRSTSQLLPIALN